MGRAGESTGPAGPGRSDLEGRLARQSGLLAVAVAVAVARQVGVAGPGQQG